MHPDVRLAFEAFQSPKGRLQTLVGIKLGIMMS